jgi:hypothetical protein
VRRTGKLGALLDKGSSNRRSFWVSWLLEKFPLPVFELKRQHGFIYSKRIFLVAVCDENMKVQGPFFALYYHPD